MPFYRTYRGQCLMFDDFRTLQVDIWDTAATVIDIDDVEVIPVQLGPNPFTISVIDNDNSKFTTIRSKTARVELMTENAIDLMTFTSGSDRAFYVEAQIGVAYVFRGYLITDDISQAFMPDSNVLTLMATDGLGLIADVKLTDSDGNMPVNENRIASYIAWCLQKTGLQRNIYVVNNIRHGTGQRTVGFSNFSNPSSTIFFPLETVDSFYVGQEIKVTGGSVLNLNSVFTVEVVNGGGTNIQVSPAPVHESGVANAVFLDTSSDGHLYDKVYLDAKTFQQSIGEMDNCRTVLEKILGFSCFITQYLGEWWIINRDEFDATDFQYSQFDYTGTFLSDLGTVALSKTVGDGEINYFITANQFIQRERPIKYAKLTYNYATPDEIPCNVTFEPGALIIEVSPEQKHYELDCWDKYKVGSGAGDPPDTDIYIRTLFNAESYETERFIVFDVDPSWHFIMSQGIPMELKDRMSIDIEKRLSSDVSGSGFIRENFVQLRLYGDDGTYWTHEGITSANDTAQWVACTASFNTNQKYHVIESDASEDQTETRTLYSGAVAPLPVGGTVKMLIYCSPEWGDIRDTYITGITFDYIPYVNGTYNQYDGQYQKVTRASDDFAAKIDDEVYISDSPKRIFKGAMLIEVGGNYKLTTKFFPYNLFGITPTPANSDRVVPYGEIQIRAVFNQYRNGNIIITGGVFGLDGDYMDIVHRYVLSNNHAGTADRYFTSTGLEQDWKAMISQMNFVEVYDRLNGHLYDEDREFKYIKQ